MINSIPLEMASDRELEILDGHGDTIRELTDSAMTQVCYRSRSEARREVRAAVIADIRRRQISE